MTAPPLVLTDNGLYCPAGDFSVDPWRPVERAVITHAHSDHVAWGCGRYLTSAEGQHVLRARLGPDTTIETLPFGESLAVGGVRLSLHPAGHIVGSAQVRIEEDDHVLVVSGDYKTEPDPTCTPFEPVRCHTFVTESTFGLPIYRWPDRLETFEEINAWWRANREAGRASLLFGYALGKAQRLLAGLDPSIGPIFTHGAVEAMNQAYRASGVPLPETTHAPTGGKKADWAGALIVAPPSAHATPWARKFGPASTGLASGWMRIRGTRRRKAIDRGFVLSDHADWPGLLGAIAATGAERVWVTHGYSAPLARWLQEQGREAVPLSTRFRGEHDETAPPESEPTDRAGDGPELFPAE
jgi:putative mRNA 3-end processing factor